MSAAEWNWTTSTRRHEPGPRATRRPKPACSQRRRQPRSDLLELRLRGRRTVQSREGHRSPHAQDGQAPSSTPISSVRGLEEDDLTRVLKDDAAKIADRAHPRCGQGSDPDFNRASSSHDP